MATPANTTITSLIIFFFLAASLLSLKMAAAEEGCSLQDQEATHGSSSSASLCRSHPRPPKRPPPCEDPNAHVAPPLPPFHGGGYSGGGGGTHRSPSTPTPVVSLQPPTAPAFFPPAVPAPPLIPVDPTTSPPSFPGTCTYWSSHPASVWAVFGYWGTVGGVFGLPAATTSGFVGGSMTLPQALGNTRGDGVGALLREGTAALLNSMVDDVGGGRRFAFTTEEVKAGFASSVADDRAAAAQAALFRQANEGRLKKQQH